MARCVNIGCGSTPIEGFVNYDNSFSIRIAKIPLIVGIASKLGLLASGQKKMIYSAKHQNIIWADATMYIPEKSHSVDVVYSCHMLEHLDREEARDLLCEVRRILRPGGIIRISVPNLRYHIENYLKSGDADNFILSILLGRSNLKSFIQKLTFILYGDRSHKWMYDGKSLCRLLTSVGFRDTCIMEAGKTMITEYYALDLKERSPESVFVEAVN